MNKIEQIRLSKILNDISNEVLESIRINGIDNVVDFETKHQYRDEWQRVDIRKELLLKWESLVDVSVLAVEIIQTKSHKTEIHYHNDAYAIIRILGQSEGVVDPRGCFYFYGSKDPLPAHSGLLFDIPPRMIHGFRSSGSKNPITFLSVQSKRINEDFHPV